MTLLAMLVPVSTAAATPSPPANLHVQGATTGKLALAWDPVANAKLYEFYRDGSRVGSSTRNAPETLDTYMLSPGANSNFTVRVTTADGLVSAQSAPLNVTIPSTSTAKSACSTSTLTGANTLSADINQTDGTQPCFVLGSNSSLDCGGHTITVTATSQTASVINVPSGQHVLVTNCKIKPIGSGDNVNGIHVGPATAGSPSTTDNVSIVGNTITGPTTGVYGIDAISSAHTVIANNLLYNAQIGAFDSPGLVVNANGINNVAAWTNIAAPIWIHRSSDSFIGDNSVNGGAPGTGAGSPGGGNDDAIILDNGMNNINVRDNTLSHLYDAGIEPTDPITNSHIDNNTIAYADEAGIGSYYGTWIENTTISDNKISRSRRAIWLETTSGYGLPEGKTGFSISNNVFNNNTFTSPNAGTHPTLCLTAYNAVDPVTATGNVITNNNWGTAGGLPLLVPNTLATTVTGNTPNTYATSGGC